MNLLHKVLAAHGGLERWQEIDTISAHRVFGGAIWQIKQVEGIVDEGELTAWVQEERTSLWPFTGPDRHSMFVPNKVSIETDTEVVESLEAPRDSFAGHSLETPWTELQLAYFTGYAMWTYMAEPYSLTYPGVKVSEIGEWREDGEVWDRLVVEYPPTLATHSSPQTLYVDKDGLIRRRDYEVDIAGSSPGAHYVSGHQEVGGIVVPTTRMIYVRDAGRAPVLDQLVVSIELTDIVVTDNGKGPKQDPELWARSLGD
jgi:hypothetical protein